MTDRKNDNQGSGTVDVVLCRARMKRFTVQNTSRVSKNGCYRCGKNSHAAQECWYHDKDCIKCGKRGHITRVCKQK